MEGKQQCPTRLLTVDRYLASSRKGAKWIMGSLPNNTRVNLKSRWAPSTEGLGFTGYVSHLDGQSLVVANIASPAGVEGLFPLSATWRVAHTWHPEYSVRMYWLLKHKVFVPAIKTSVLKTLQKLELLTNKIYNTNYNNYKYSTLNPMDTTIQYMGLS